MAGAEKKCGGAIGWGKCGQKQPSGRDSDVRNRFRPPPHSAVHSVTHSGTAPICFLVGPLFDRGTPFLTLVCQTTAKRAAEMKLLQPSRDPPGRCGHCKKRVPPAHGRPTRDGKKTRASAPRKICAVAAKTGQKLSRSAQKPVDYQLETSPKRWKTPEDSGFGEMDSEWRAAQAYAAKSYRLGGHDPRHLRKALMLLAKENKCQGVMVLDSESPRFRSGASYWFWPAGKSHRALLSGVCRAARRKRGTNDFYVFFDVGNSKFAVNASDVYR